MSRTIRTLILFGAPVWVGGFNLFHPVHFGPTGLYDDLYDVAGWWTTLHILNLFGFALLGLAGYLLVFDGHGVAVNLAKVAFLIFVPAYVGFDALAGIATGNLLQYANSLPVDELPAFKLAIDTFWINWVVTFLAILGSVAWTIAMSAAAVSFVVSRRAAAVLLALVAGAFTGWGFSANTFGTLPWWVGLAIIGAISLVVVKPALPYTLLILAGVLLGTTHVVPFGPLGMACFMAAAAIVRLGPRSTGAREVSVPSQP